MINVHINLYILHKSIDCGNTKKEFPIYNILQAHFIIIISNLKVHDSMVTQAIQLQDYPYFPFPTRAKTPSTVGEPS